MMRRIVIVVLMAVAAMAGRAQTSEAGLVEVFCGAELNYADVNYLRLYDVLVNLTPGVKWHLGHDWLLSGQAFVPVVNQGYENRYSKVRLTNATVAKQLHFGSQHLKVTGGLFGMDRYGLDVRWLWPVSSWLMLSAQAGYTGSWRMAAGDAKGWATPVEQVVTKAVDFGAIDRFTGTVGAHVWLAPWNTELRVSGGRYLGEDLGGQVDVMRHFRHCTVGVYAQLHERKLSRYREAGGFKVVMMLPDSWSWRQGKFTARTANHFRLTYNAQADGRSMEMYTTDPEENERVYPVRVEWGTGGMRNEK